MIMWSEEFHVASRVPYLACISVNLCILENNMQKFVCVNDFFRTNHSDQTRESFGSHNAAAVPPLLDFLNLNCIK